MKIKPIFDRVVLSPVKQENSLGLILPDDETKSVIMEVVALGTSEKPFTVHIGDKVVINTFAGFRWTFEKQTYVLAKETDILAILEEENND